MRSLMGSAGAIARKADWTRLNLLVLLISQSDAHFTVSALADCQRKTIAGRTAAVNGSLSVAHAFTHAPQKRNNYRSASCHQVLTVSRSELVITMKLCKTLQGVQ